MPSKNMIAFGTLRIDEIFVKIWTLKKRKVCVAKKFTIKVNKIEFQYDITSKQVDVKALKENTLISFARITNECSVLARMCQMTVELFFCWGTSINNKNSFYCQVTTS